MILPFTHLRAAVKCELNVALAPCTAIVGPNSASKTAVLDAYRLALTGRHSIGKDPSDLYELAPVGHHGVYSELVNGAGGTCTFELKTAGGKAKKPTHEVGSVFGSLTDAQREQILPIEQIGDLLKGSTIVRETVIRRFGLANEVPTPLALSVSQASLWAELITEARGVATIDGVEPNPAAILSEIGSLLRSRKSRKSKEATALERDLEARGNAAGAVAGVEMLPSLEAQLVTAQEWARAATLRARREQLLAALVDKPADQPKPVVAVAKTDITALEAKIQAAQVLASVAAASETEGSCRLCQVGKISRERVQAIQGRLRELEQSLSALRTQAYVPQTPKTEDWAVKEARLRGELEGIETALLNVKSPPALTAAELQAKITTIKAAAQARTELVSATSKLREIRQQLEDGKILEKEAARLETSLLTEVATRAADAVNKYMPADRRAALEVTDKKCQWRVIGTDGRAHKKGGMAGREFGSLIIALACAWSEGAPFRVLLLDDAELGPFDPGNVGILCDTLREAVEAGVLNQVLICSSRPYEVPNNWHKLFRGEP